MVLMPPYRRWLLGSRSDHGAIIGRAKESEAQPAEKGAPHNLEYGGMRRKCGEQHHSAAHRHDADGT